MVSSMWSEELRLLAYVSRLILKLVFDVVIVDLRLDPTSYPDFVRTSRQSADLDVMSTHGLA